MNWLFNQPTLKQVTENPLTNGIFSYITGVDFVTNDTKAHLNALFYGNHSGSKIISGYTEMYLDDGVLGSVASGLIGQFLSATYKDKWNQLFKLFKDTNYISTESISKSDAGSSAVSNVNEFTSSTSGSSNRLDNQAIA